MTEFQGVEHMMEIDCAGKRYRIFRCGGDAEEMERAVTAIKETTEFISGSSIRLLGVDAEFAMETPTLLQLCSGDVVVVIELLQATPSPNLLRLFSSPLWIKVGNDVETDFRRLVRRYTDINTRSVFDLFILGRLAGMKCPSLFNMFRSLTGVMLSRDKSTVLSDYQSLSEKMIVDAALDAIASYEVGMNFFSRDLGEPLRAISIHDDRAQGTVRVSRRDRRDPTKERIHTIKLKMSKASFKQRIFDRHRGKIRRR